MSEHDATMKELIEGFQKSILDSLICRAATADEIGAMMTDHIRDVVGPPETGLISVTSSPGETRGAINMMITVKDGSYADLTLREAGMITPVIQTDP